MDLPFSISFQLLKRKGNSLLGTEGASLEAAGRITALEEGEKIYQKAGRINILVSLCKLAKAAH